MQTVRNQNAHKFTVPLFQGFLLPPQCVHLGRIVGCAGGTGFDSINRQSKGVLVCGFEEVILIDAFQVVIQYAIL